MPSILKKLWDSFGREVTAKDAKSAPSQVVTVIDANNRSMDYPTRGIKPSTLASYIEAADGGDSADLMQVYDDIEWKDTMIGSQLQTRKLAVAGLDWTLEPADDSAQAVKVRDAVLENLNALNMHNLTIDALDAVGKGFSVGQLFWSAEKGQAWIEKIERVPSWKITWSQSMTPKVITVSDSMGIDPPPFRFYFLTLSARSGFPYQTATLKSVALIWMLKNYAVKDWAGFCEIFGQPLRVGKYPPSASKDDISALRQAVRAIGTDWAATMPDGVSIEFVEAQKYGSISVYEKFISYCDTQIQMAILGQVLATGVAPGGAGSYAQAAVHNLVRHDILEADCRALDEMVNRDIVRPLVLFNFGADAPMPVFSHDYEPPADEAAELAKYKTLMVDLGFPVSREHIEEKFGVPAARDGENILTPPRSGNQASALETAATAALKLPAGEIHLAAMDAAASPMDLIDALAKTLAGDARFDLAAISNLVGSAQTYDEIQAGLYSLYPNIGRAALADALHRAWFAAEMMGRLAVKEEANHKEHKGREVLGEKP